MLSQVGRLADATEVVVSASHCSFFGLARLSVLLVRSLFGGAVVADEIGVEPAHRVDGCFCAATVAAPVPFSSHGDHSSSV
jgi:hypothetical protein